jgi:hypothetical protein
VQPRQSYHFGHTPLVSLHLPAQNGWTGLIRACVNGDYAMAGILLKKGANVNAQVEAHPLSPVSHELASAQPRRLLGVVQLCGHIQTACTRRAALSSERIIPLIFCPLTYRKTMHYSAITASTAYRIYVLCAIPKCTSALIPLTMRPPPFSPFTTRMAQRHSTLPLAAGTSNSSRCCFGIKLITPVKIGCVYLFTP